MSNTFDKLSVLDSFIEEVNSYLPEIEANLERLTQSPGDMEALEETHRRTHTIGGSASMMDFPGLAHVAQGMEDILGDVLDGLSTLNQPTVELLQRSLVRLHHLISGIHHGIDENAIVAEDDADYDQYRTQQEAGAQGVQGGMITPEYVKQATGQMYAIQDIDTSMISSLDEMLASFRTPTTTNEEISWPEEPVLRAEFPPRPEVQFPVPPMLPAQHAQFEAPTPMYPPLPPLQPSALEMLAGSTRRQDMPPIPPASQLIPPTPPVTPLTPRYQPPEEEFYPAASVFLPPVPPYSQPTLPQSALPPLTGRQETPVQLPQMSPVLPQFPSGPLPAQQPPANLRRSSMPSGPLPAQQPPANLGRVSMPSGPLPAQQPPANLGRGSMPSVSPDRLAAITPPTQLYQEMRSEAQALSDQASSFKRTLTQLRVAASVIEAQRAEFKGFLDGSRDALDRMEDWAGKAMGLNLRNSPEQVRRYLPLSVMWVANSKLKKILDMLLQMAGGAEGTEEQIQWILEQLHDSITACGEILQRTPEETSSPPGAGWSSWEMQVNADPNAMRESVTFERRGDLTALRAEMEAQLREELRAEYESLPPTLAQRAELEQNIREEVRRDFESRQHLHERIARAEKPENIHEIEDRLRNEIEIQVRSELLSQLEAGGGGSALAAQMALMGLSAPANPALTPHVPSAPLAPPSHNPTTTTSAAMVSDFGEEAADIFRLEAEEHLQTISMYVATLEHAPTDLEPIQGIRRATHTLKGAAGMMGFRAIADLCHVSEDMLDGIMEGTVSISPTVLSLILDTAEALDSLVNGKGTVAENEHAVQSLRLRYGELLGEQASLASIPEDEIEVEEEEPETNHAPVTSVVDNEAHSAGVVMSGAARSDLSVRVSLSKLDELVNLFGELLVNRTILEERLQRLTRLVSDTGVSSTRLRDVGQKLESRFEAATLPSGRSVQVMPGEGNQDAVLRPGKNGRGERIEPAHLAEFDELELDRYTEFHQLARGLSEGISDMTTLSTEMETVIRDCEGVFSRESRLSTTFQDRLMKARLVPLSTMIPRLYRTARAVALKQHKEFELLLKVRKPRSTVPLLKKSQVPCCI